MVDIEHDNIEEFITDLKNHVGDRFFINDLKNDKLFNEFESNRKLIERMETLYNDNDKNIILSNNFIYDL